MTNQFQTLFLALLLSLLLACTNDHDTKELVLFDFETALDTDQIKLMDGAYDYLVNNGDRKLKVISDETSKSSKVILFRTEKDTWDLTGFYQVKADVQNIGDTMIQVEMFVGNDPDGLKRWYCSDYIDLKPGESGTITVDLAWSPWVFDPQPEIVGMRGAPGILKTEIAKIGQVSFNSRYASTSHMYALDNVRAIGCLELRETSNFFPFVNEFGQYKHADWPGKIHDKTELRACVDTELSDLELHAAAPNRSRFGGWKGGPKLAATGFFRRQKRDGKWWLVDPDGYLFWSNGINCVSTGQTNTGIEGREHYFESLPSTESDYASFYGTSRWSSHGYYKDYERFKTYNFYEANLYTKYGPDWHDIFAELAQRRIKSWGMNTIGFVSDKKAIEMHQTPYVGSIWIRGTKKIEGSNGFWGKFHDVFDTDFRPRVRRSMELQKSGAGDPWCIGFFVDNELSWGAVGSLAEAVLQSPPTQASKREFISDLQMKYQSINEINRTWKTTYKSWDDILMSNEVPTGDGARWDLTNFYKKIVDTYFQVVSEELDRIAPGQCYLGCRFAWANNDIVLRSAAKYCDIISFNKYEYSVENVTLPEGLDHPVMIGEFHFGATDRGYFHPGVKKAKDQKQRGEMYQSYIQGALRNPLMVGAHWFQYTDQAFTGRGDGENYNVGLVNVCDVPYPELVKKLRETNYTMYNYRSEH